MKSTIIISLLVWLKAHCLHKHSELTFALKKQRLTLLILLEYVQIYAQHNLTALKYKKSVTLMFWVTNEHTSMKRYDLRFFDVEYYMLG